LRILTQRRAAVVATDESCESAGLPRLRHAPQSIVEALKALEIVEARLCVALRSLERMKVENDRLGHSLEAASRRALAVQRIALHDGLTGLPNRRFLIERLQGAIAIAGERHRHVALLFIDLDGFKGVNDGFGHAVADRLLAVIARRIAACVRAEDIACRYGGDEFVALLTNLGDPAIATAVSQKIRDHIAESYTIAGHEIRITASIGLSVYPDHGDRFDALLNHADVAMYRDKSARRECRQSVESQDS
jgi:diguanylate cyclase